MAESHTKMMWILRVAIHARKPPRHRFGIASLASRRHRRAAGYNVPGPIRPLDSALTHNSLLYEFVYFPNRSPPRVASPRRGCCGFGVVCFLQNGGSIFWRAPPVWCSSVTFFPPPRTGGPSPP